MQIGILGGTFNPPHAGHLIIAEDILKALRLDKIFFIPTNISPHKEDGPVTGKMRLRMVELAIAENSAFEVLDLEIKRGGTSFTIDTVRELKKAYPHDEFYLIVGSDLANDFSSWKNYRQLRQEVKIVVANRKDYPLRNRDSYLVADIRQLELSSSQVRELARKQSSLKGLVKESVAEYIQKHNLYQDLRRSND